MKLSFEIQPWELKLMFDLMKSDQIEDEEELEDDDDAEDEQCCCNHEPAEEACDDAECEAHRKALDKLAECLRASGIADVTFHYCGHAIRRDDKR